MYFIDKRIQVICDQLKALRVRDSRELPDWQYSAVLFSAGRGGAQRPPLAAL